MATHLSCSTFTARFESLCKGGVGCSNSKRVNAYYGSFQALFDIGLSVEQGEAVAVIGPNGAGKTTLLRVISGLVRPGDGTLTMEGKNLKTVAAPLPSSSSVLPMFRKTVASFPE